MKTNRFILIALLIILVLSISSQSAELQTDTKDKYGAVKTEDANNVIEIELDITGLNPTKEYAVIDIKNIGKKLSGGLNDIMVISPIPLYNIQIESDKYKTKTVVTDQSYTCSGSSYGYIDTTHFFCNNTYSFINNVTLMNETFDSQQIINVPTDSVQKTNVVTWSTSEIITEKEKEVKTLKLKSKSISSNYGYGIFMYYIEAEEFLTGLQDSYTIKVTPFDFGLLPIKYTVCIGDSKNVGTAFCLDPTITSSRTWTTNADFTNGTILNNMTTSNDQLEISVGSPAYATTLSQGFETADVGAITCDIQSVTGAATFEYVNTGCRTGNNCVKHTQDAGQYAAQTSKAACAINTSYYVSPTNEEPYNITFWTKDDYSGGGGGYVTGVFVRNTSNMVHTGYYMHTTSGFNLFNETLRAGTPISNFMGYTSASNNDWQKVELLISEDCVNISHFSDVGTLIDSKSCISRPSDVWETSNLYFGFGGYTQQGEQGGTAIWYDDLLIQQLTSATLTQSQLQDRQSWTPQSGNTLINLSAVVVTTGTSTVKFRYNSTNASLDTSAYTTLSTNGTNDLTFNLNANDPIFYEFMLQDTSGSVTPKITSYTINEANLVTDTCTYSSGDWTIQSADNCNIITSNNMAGNKVIFNGTGHTRITGNVTSCGELTFKGGAEVTISGGGRLC